MFTVTQCFLFFAAACSADSVKKILVVGDSWGDVIAGHLFHPFGESFFTRTLREHRCSATVTNIAAVGTMVRDWIIEGDFLTSLEDNVKTHDYVWVSLGGNDAHLESGWCAQNRSKTAEECGDEIFIKTKPEMATLVDNIHKLNPTARVVGFGYDTMFGGLGCSVVTHGMFPQCWSSGESGNRCFNTQLVRIQAIWDELALNRSWVDAINILGLTQVAAGDTKASIGHPNMDQMGPAQYWPDYEGCFHPSVYSSEKGGSGAMIIMEEFQKQYWSKQLGCGDRVGQILLEPVLV